MMATQYDEGDLHQSVNAFLAMLLISLVVLMPVAFRHWVLSSQGLLKEVSVAADLPNWPIQMTEPLPTVVVDQEEVAKETLDPEIVMFSRAGCPPCELWWALHRPAWEKKGWPVKKVEYSGPTPTPFFDVCDGEKRFRVDGMLTAESYKKAGGR
jgi:hypothetical protein